MQSATPFVLHLAPGTAAANQDSDNTQDVPQDKPKPKAKRGPKPKVKPNPQAHLIHMAMANGLSFIDDAVMAGLYIAVGDSGGKLNVRPRDVRKVICFNVISTAELVARLRTLTGDPICERTARYLAAAARLAIGGIERHFHRNPTLLKRLQAQCDRTQRVDEGWPDLDDVAASYSLAQWEWQEFNAA
ncbi:hypothetical protein M5G27_07315 [Pseudomonas shahriarae]|uniref:Uncharacterized protein n=1 Tax=Pseudomonas shahriarae TaxID=2745512 RepID=A0A9X4BZN1_9PSED|nr:hypothetical protein [Pseudomonas shahriarae]MDD1007289.1 hypothetical protein [Pseudomonas shahriarae]